MENVELRKQWDVRIADYRSSGLTATVWCERNGVTLPQLKYWTQKKRKEAKDVGGVKWTRVDVKPVSAAPSKIMISVGAARIEVESGFDAAMLAQVLCVVTTSC